MVPAILIRTAIDPRSRRARSSASMSSRSKRLTIGVAGLLERTFDGGHLELATLLLAAFWVVVPGSALAFEEDETSWSVGASAFAAARAIPVDAASVSSPRGDFEDEANRLFGMLGIGFDLTLPAPDAHPAVPRAFVRFDVATFFDEEDRVVNDDAPGSIVVPVIDNNGDGIPDAPTPVATIQGLGSATGVKTEIPSIGLAVGFDWRIAMSDQVVHVKPSLEWRYEEERVSTIAGIAESIDGDPGDCPCRTALASGQTTEPFHGIGPGLEIAIEAGSLGPFESSVFIRGQALYQLDRRVEVEATAPFSDDSGSVSVESRYTRSRWDYIAGVGVRLSLRRGGGEP